MLYVRSDAGAVVCDGLIYCIGGFTGETIHSSVEAIRPSALPYVDEFSNWFKVGNMRRRRSGVSCESYNGVIYAVGGYDGESQLDSIERFAQIILYTQRKNDVEICLYAKSVFERKLWLFYPQASYKNLNLTN